MTTPSPVLHLPSWSHPLDKQRPQLQGLKGWPCFLKPQVFALIWKMWQVWVIFFRQKYVRVFLTQVCDQFSVNKWFHQALPTARKRVWGSYGQRPFSISSRSPLAEILELWFSGFVGFVYEQAMADTFAGCPVLPCQFMQWSEGPVKDMFCSQTYARGSLPKCGPNLGNVVQEKTREYWDILSNCLKNMATPNNKALGKDSTHEKRKHIVRPSTRSPSASSQKGLFVTRDSGNFQRLAIRAADQGWTNSQCWTKGPFIIWARWCRTSFLAPWKKSTPVVEPSFYGLWSLLNFLSLAFIGSGTHVRIFA